MEQGILCAPQAGPSFCPVLSQWSERLKLSACMRWIIFTSFVGQLPVPQDVWLQGQPECTLKLAHKLLAAVKDGWPDGQSRQHG